MVDTNLTHLNVSLNVSLIEPSQPGWTSLFDPASWLPVVVVLIGAYATYFYANQLEDRKYQYNLKVEVYFELLDAVHSLISHREHLSNLKTLEQNDDVSGRIRDEIEMVTEARNSLSQIISKLQVVGNEDVLAKFIDFRLYSSTPEIDPIIFTEKQVKLTQAIRKDLMSGKGLDLSPFSHFLDESEH